LKAFEENIIRGRNRSIKA